MPMPKKGGWHPRVLEGPRLVGVNEETRYACMNSRSENEPMEAVDSGIGVLRGHFSIELEGRGRR